MTLQEKSRALLADFVMHREVRVPQCGGLRWALLACVGIWIVAGVVLWNLWWSR